MVTQSKDLRIVYTIFPKHNRPAAVGGLLRGAPLG